MTAEQIEFLLRLDKTSAIFHECPFCGEKEGLPDNIAFHVAEHLRQYALLSLPWHSKTAAQSEDESRNAVPDAMIDATESSIIRMEEYKEEASVSDQSDSVGTDSGNSDRNTEYLIRKAQFNTFLSSMGCDPGDSRDAIILWVDAVARDELQDLELVQSTLGRELERDTTRVDVQEQQYAHETFDKTHDRKPPISEATVISSGQQWGIPASGIEIAGIVLGVLGALIKGVGGYNEVVTHRDISLLVESLKDNKIMFSNSVEHLLRSIVPADELSRLLNDHTGDIWRKHDLDQRVIAHLGEGAENITKKIDDIHRTLAQLQKKLPVSVRDLDSTINTYSQTVFLDEER